MARAVFLDRDGTINSDPGYLNDATELKLIPGVDLALRKLQDAGYLLVIVSNQSGVGRGKITPAQLDAVHLRLDEILAARGVKIARYELCFHRPEEDCDCRKPKPKLILDAARSLSIDLGKSIMIGDKASDVRAGRAAGCHRTVLVRTGSGAKDEETLAVGEADYVAWDLLQASEWILGQID